MVIKHTNGKYVNFYVYMHSTADTGRPFYIGKGRGRRAWSLKSRNSYWVNVVNKHGLVVTLLGENLDEAEALSLEMKMIALLGRDSLCNMTDGGEGSSGYIATEETRLKISLANRNPSEARRAEMRRIATGRKLSEASRLKLSMSKRNMSEETRQRMSIANKRPCSEATKIKMSKAIKGRVLTEEWKAKIGAANFVPIRTTCGIEFKSAKFATEWLRLNGQPKADSSSIVKCCKGKLKSAYGYIWEYVNDDH